MCCKVTLVFDLDCTEEDESIDVSVIRNWLKTYIRTCINHSVRDKYVDNWFEIDMSDDGDYHIVNEYKIVNFE